MYSKVRLGNYGITSAMQDSLVSSNLRDTHQTFQILHNLETSMPTRRQSCPHPRILMYVVDIDEAM